MTTAQPWDDDAMRTRLLDEITAITRVPLATMRPAKEPAVYLHFLRAPHLASILGTQVAMGIIPAYVGAAIHDQNERLGRYRQSVAGMTALDARDVYVASLPLPSSASVLFAEQALLDAFVPILNGTGWGAKRPGAGRPGRRCSTVDALLPCRYWAAKPTVIDTTIAPATIVAALARRPAALPRWPALTSRSAA